MTMNRQSYREHIINVHPNENPLDLKVRGITNQVRLENEVQVAIKGPEVQHCRGIVREAMRVGEGAGNFIRRSNNIKQYTVSKAVDTLAKKKPKVPFML